MRKWFVLVVATSLVLGAAGVAGAAPLNWSGTATVTIADIPSFTFHGGGVATVNQSAGGVPAHLSTLRLKGSRGQIGGIDTEFITDPETAGNGIAAVIVELTGGTGTFAPISGGAASAALTQNIMPVYGMAKICLLSTACTQYLVMPFTVPTTVNGVPGSSLNAVGVGGLLTAGGYGGIRISLQGAPWTIKTATVTDQITTPTGGSRIFTQQTAKGWAHAPASTTSSTAQPSGVVQLVTPGQIVSNIPLGSNDKLAGMVVMMIHFIPEPGMLLLLGSGVVGLGLLGWRRKR